MLDFYLFSWNKKHELNTLPHKNKSSLETYNFYLSISRKITSNE